MVDLSKLPDIYKMLQSQLGPLQDEAIETGDFSKVDEAAALLERLDSVTDAAAKKYNIAQQPPVQEAPVAQAAPPQAVVPPPVPVQPPQVPFGVVNPQGLPQAGAPAQAVQPPVVVNVTPPTAEAKPFTPSMSLPELKMGLSRQRLRELQAKVIDLYKYKAPAISGEQIFGKYWNPKDNPDLLKDQDPIGFFNNLNPKFESVVAGINPAADPKYPDEGRAAIDEARRIISELTPVVPPSPAEAAAAKVATMEKLPGAYTPAEMEAAKAGQVAPPVLPVKPPTNVPVTDTVVPEEEEMAQEMEARLAQEELNKHPDDVFKTMAPQVEQVYDSPKTMVKDAMQTVQQMAPDYAAEFESKMAAELAEFERRVKTEVGEKPKADFLTILGMILGGLTGNQTALKLWTDRVNNYSSGRQRIGQEMFSAKKAGMREAAADRRMMNRDEASFKRMSESLRSQEDRQDKRISAQNEQLDKRLSAQEKVNNVRANVSLRNADLQALTARIASANAQTKTRLMPYQEQLDVLKGKANNLSRLASFSSITADEWASQMAVIDQQIAAIMAQMQAALGGSGGSVGR